MKRRIFSEDLGEEEPFINLTPLIDVVFVVLISFMLIAPLLQVDRVELAFAGESTEKISPQSTPLSISIHANNTLSVRGKEVSFKDLELILKAEKKLHPQETPLLLCDKNGSFGTYQEIKNLIEKCGFEQLDVGLKPK